MKAGANKTNITPPLGLPMGGSVSDSRRADGIAVPLFCRTIVMQDNNGIYSSMTSCDLLQLERKYIDKAFKAASEKTGIPTDNMMLCSSHTHSAPQTSEVFMTVIPDDVANYLENLVIMISESIIDAHSQMKDARIGAAVGLDDTGIAENSRYLLKDGTISWFGFKRDEIVKATGPIDPHVAATHIIDDCNVTIGLIYNYACHACTVMLNQYSADYPGATSAFVEKKLGGTALFFPGACGNIHPIKAWLSPDGIISYPHSQDKNNAVEKNGRILADKVLDIVDGINKYEDVIIKSIKNEIDLPVRNVENTGVHHIEKQLRIRKLDDNSIKEHLEVYRLELDELQKRANTFINTVIQVTRIGDYAIVGVPAEMFVEFGLEIKEKSPFKYTFVCENVNDCVGYTPTEEAFKLGGYQTWAAKSSGLSPESGDMIVKAVVEMLLVL